MSLINDALKRARVEALRQEETERRTYRAVPAHSRRPDRQRLLLAGGWVAAALAVAVAAWLWLATGAVTTRETGESTRPEAATAGHPGSGSAALRSSQTKTRSDPESPIEGTAQPAAEASDPRSPMADSGTSPQVAVAIPSDETTSDRTVATSARSSDAPSSSAAPRSEASESTRFETPRAVTPPDPAASEPSRRPVRTAGRSGLEPGETYLRSVTSADGSIVELGGIAYSTSRPIAVINGSVVSNGDLIAGFTVVSIEPGRVELEADGVRIFLALH